MCGIVGFAGFEERGLLDRMCDAILHRGPDGEGKSELCDARMAIGMRRLAIIDIAGGGQPFRSPDNKVQLVFNGEIYNHDELREELRALGHTFASRSDTEVVLAAYLNWGNDAWSRLHGMFMVAIADCRGPAPRLVVARDRVGIKPIYYHFRNGRLIFGSELKALLVSSEVRRDVDLGAVRNYLALRYVPGPGSLIQGVRKLPPGHFMEFERGAVAVKRWWTPPAASMVEHDLDPAQAQAVFGEAIRLAVRRHMISDVPVGVFLSGGIDSTLIAALMAENGSEPVRSFTIGFPGLSNGDCRRARRTAEIIGSQHRELECQASDMALLPDIAWSLDEPVGDAIVVPMYVLSREASKDVKVVLSGEGADEMLGGYMFHRKLVQIERLKRFVPNWGFTLGAKAMQLMPVSLLERHFDYPGRLGTEGRRKLARFMASAAREDVVGLYRESISLLDPGDILAAGTKALSDMASVDLPHPESTFDEGSALQRLVSAQYGDWLPDDILMKLDKMTMAHSLEGRVPFLDDAVIQASARIPDALKLAPGASKKVMRDFARSLLPGDVVDSPKEAFYIPLESYIREPGVADLLRRTLDLDRTRRRGLFRPEWIRRTLDAPSSEGFLPLKRVFSIVMLELWFERFCPDASWA